MATPEGSLPGQRSIADTLVGRFRPGPELGKAFKQIVRHIDSLSAPLDKKAADPSKITPDIASFSPERGMGDLYILTPGLPQIIPDMFASLVEESNSPDLPNQIKATPLS